MLSVALPAVQPVLLEPYARLNDARINESSGLARSRTREGTYWTHNDSADEPRIFAVTSAGELVGVPITVTAATNVDWEDIAVDPAGNLVVGDVGNNFNARKDLCIYVVPEPDPRQDVRTAPARRIPVRYADQDGVPPRLFNFDCEAVFCAHGAVYFLTKNRSDTNTSLYRLEARDLYAQDQDARVLRRIGTFAIGGMVTGADAAADGYRLAVLTYTSIWLFETEGGEEYFQGRIRWLPIRAGQCEGICLDEDSLLLSNERGELFRVPLTALLPVRD